VRIALLHDHHTHYSLYAAWESGLSVAALASKQELLAQLSRLPEKELSVVFGWNSSRIALTENDLEKLPPLVLNDISLHGFLLSAAAREMLAVTHAEILMGYRDSHWRERNVARLLNFMVAASGLTAPKIASFRQSLRQVGVASGTEMMLASEGALELLTPLIGSFSCYTDLATFEALSPEARQRVYGLKLFTDGSLGARSAALSERFLDNSSGTLVYSAKELRDEMELNLTYKPRLAIHALGDAAIRQVVDAVRELRLSTVRIDEIRIEHAEFIDRSTARQAKELGIKLCMQPNFSSDSRVYEDRLSREMRARINPFRMLIDEVSYVPGEDLLFGSDGMPHGAEFALQEALFPLFDSQRITLEEFVAAYTLGDNFERGFIEVDIDAQQRRVKVKEIVFCDEDQKRS
jgi:predicted amidohydrolase YtcJ